MYIRFLDDRLRVPGSAFLFPFVGYWFRRKLLISKQSVCINYADHVCFHHFADVIFCMLCLRSFRNNKYIIIWQLLVAVVDLVFCLYFAQVISRIFGWNTIIMTRSTGVQNKFNQYLFIDFIKFALSSKRFSLNGKCSSLLCLSMENALSVSNVFSNYF